MKEQKNHLLFALLREELCGLGTEDIPTELDSDSLRELYLCAKHHDLAHLIADALGKHQLLPPEADITAKFEKQHMMAIFRYQRMHYALGELCDVMEQEKIPIIPLKGSVIRDLYPEPWMRTSCDIDVLVREENLDHAIGILTEKLGYVYEERGSHDVSLRSASGVHVELHYSLLEDNRANQAKSILQDVWSYVTPAEGKQFHMLLLDDFFYFYHIAHMAKHLEVGGCGVRPFLDLYLLDIHADETQKMRDELLEKAGLLRFANAARALSKVWMAKEQPNELSQELAAYVLGGGVYGTTENRIAAQQKKKGGRLGYVLSRIFMPYDWMKMQYPILQRKKWLTPFYHIKRWFGILKNGRFQSSVRELEISRTTKKEETDRVARLFENLGM